MDKEVFIENLELVAHEVMEINPKDKSVSDCIRALQSAMIDLISVMIGAIKNGDGAPAGAGAPAGSSDPAS